MKKQKRFLGWIAGALLMLLSISSWAQTPTYTCDLRNLTQVSCNVFEFDVWIKRTGSNEFYLALFQMGITMNPALVNGGTITVTPVANSSTLTNQSQVPGPSKFSYDPVKNCIIVTPVPPPGCAPASKISSSGFGTKFIRIRVMNSVPWPAAAPTLAWNFSSSTGYITKMFAYVSCINTDITVQASHTTTNLANNNTNFDPGIAQPLVQTVTGDGGTYCDLPAATGAPIGLAASQNGVAYRLFKNGVATSDIIYGRAAGVPTPGSDITFGNQTQGFYQVESYICGSGLFPTSATILPPIPPATASVFITTDQPGGNIVPANTLVTFTANPDPYSAAQPGTAYQWYVNGTPTDVTITMAYIPSDGDVVDLEMYADPAACVTPDIATATMTMQVIATNPPSVFNITGAGSYCAGTDGMQVGLDGSQFGVSYQLKKDGIDLGTPVPGTGSAIIPGAWSGMTAGTYTVFGTANGLVLTISGTTQMLPLAGIVITENPLVPVSVSIVASANPVCAGTSVTFTATPVNGGTPAYQWFLNGGPVGAGLATYTTIPANGDQVYVIMTSSFTTCVTGNPATSNTIAMTVDPLLPVSVSIVASANPTCAGTSVTFTATPVNGGIPDYQWFLNGLVAGATSTFTYDPTDGDQVYVVMTSSLTCVSGNPATSNTITMTVNPVLPVSVSIVASANPVCAGTSVTFTATPVNGGTPAYQWYLNGAPVGGGLATFTYVPVDNGQVYVIMTSSVACGSGNPATSNTINMIVDPALPVSVSIVAEANPVCAGTSVTFTATPVNGGTPAYQWFLNGAPVGSGLATYSVVPANGDQVHVVMTSSMTCVSGNPATSNTVSMTVNPLLPVTVSIVASDNPICPGTTVTFTATPANGGTPSYQWYKNGTPVGLNQNTYTDGGLVDGDQVYVIMTSSLECISGSPATSNAVTMSVVASVPAGVSIVVSANPSCEGSSVTVTATPVNGGTPTYQWYLNGAPVGAGLETYNFIPVDGDNVYVVMTSSLGCATGNPATSNTITMIVNPVLPVSVTIIVDANPVNSGIPVTFTATPTNGGLTPAYQWFVNNIEQLGQILSTFTYTPVNGDAVKCILTSNESCTSGNPATSNEITMVVIASIIPSLTGPIEVCEGASAIYTTDAGMTGYSWSLPLGGGSFVTGPLSNQITVTWTTAGARSVNVTYDGAIPEGTTLDVTVNPILPVSVTITASANPVCAGTSVTFTAFPVNGGTPSYQWYLNGAPVGAGLATYTYVPVNGDAILVVLTSSETCQSGGPATSNTITMTVNPDATIILTSTAGTNAQSLCINTPITNITYAIGGGGTGAGVTGLPTGVTGAYLAGVFTISGTPSVTGTFNYTVTTTGTCVQASATGSIIVNPDATIALTSAPGSNNQSLCINTPIATITYSIGGGGTGAGVIGLPTGVTGTYLAGVFTISGTPSINGTFNYTVTTTGTCIQASATGTITVNPDATITLTSAPGTNVQSLCINTAITNITYAIGGGGTGAGVIGLPTGVTGVYNAGVFTISGTPSVSGTFNYTVTTTGTCIQATAAGTITVNPNATITLTSAPGTNIQSLCINTAITNITYSIGGGGTGAGVTGLPAGVTGVYSAGVFTISGTPSVTGTFNYTVTTTGTCVQTTATGTITVNPNATITLTSAPGTNVQSRCINTAITNITYSIGGGGTGAGVTGLPTGVTGVYNAGVFTISGTPSVTGTFNYTVTTTGTCVQATATGTITVTPNATITLTSAPGTNVQSLCINTAITNITYAIGGGGTGAGVTGLPTGVTGVYNSGVFTISGTPSVSGTFNYTVTTTGTCVQATATGTITVNPNATITLTSAPGSNVQSHCINTPITNITYAIGGGGTGAGVTGLPTGVTGVYNAGVFTISGTPSVTGTFNYTVTTTGTCVQATATGTITVTPLPVPTITGYTSMCVNVGPLDYVTEPGMTGYNWTVSPGNDIYSGQGTNHVQINWTVPGSQWVAVIYTNPAGCSPAAPFQLNVFVEPLPGPAGNITGDSAVCGGTNGVAYSVGVIANSSSYVWSLPAGASIATGAGTNSITVDFGPFASSGNITVYGNNTCGNGTSSPPFAVNVTPLPDTAGIITGQSAVCQGVSGVIYTVPAIANATSYFWTVPAGATIVAGSTTNSITVDFSLTAVSGTITVYGINSCGNGSVGPAFQVTVNPIPPTPIITQINDTTLHSNIPTGNLWYFEGLPAPPPNTGQDYITTQSGHYWCVVTLNGCNSDTSNHIEIVMIGIQTIPSTIVFNVYPVPNDGRFTVSITYPTLETFTIQVYNTLGVKISEIRNVEVNGTTERTIDLRPTPSGVYSVVIENSSKHVIRKILINR